MSFSKQSQREQIVNNLPWLVHQIRKSPVCCPESLLADLQLVTGDRSDMNRFVITTPFERMREGEIVGRPFDLEGFLMDAYGRAARLVACLLWTLKSHQRSVGHLASSEYCTLVTYWWARAVNGTLEKEAKAKFAAIYGWVNDQMELPDYPWDRFDFLGSHTIRRWLRQKRTSGAVRAFAFDLLNLKKGTLRPDEAFKQASLQKTKLLLTEEPPQPSEEEAELRERVLEEVYRTALEVAMWIRTGRTLAAPRPTLSACRERSQGEGGGLDEFLETHSDEIERSLRMFYHPRTGVIELRVPELEYLHSRLLNEWNTDLASLNAVPVALLEAFKVRIITKAEAVRHWLVQPLQKVFWRALQAFPCFALTGRPDEPEDVARMFDQLLPKESLVSGDYESATDLLLSEVSSTVLRGFKAPDIARMMGSSMSPDGSLSRGRRGSKRPMIDPRLWFPMEQALVGHTLWFKNQVSGAMEAFPQKNGQLMGSFISFPVLCVANAAICRMAVEESRGQRLTLFQTPMIINGDDCLFPSTAEGYDLWKRAGRAIGLKPSVGKNYVSKTLAVINSQEYRRHTTELGLTSLVTRTGYHNLGIIFGNQRSSCTNDGDQLPGPLAGSWREFERRQPGVDLERWRSRFIKQRMPLLKKLPNSWALPSRMGGLGIVNRPLTWFESKWATYWRDHPTARIGLESFTDTPYRHLRSAASQERQLGGLRLASGDDPEVSDTLVTLAAWNQGAGLWEDVQFNIRDYARAWQRVAKSCKTYHGAPFQGEALDLYVPRVVIPRVCITLS